jgi:hypothetical protein
MKKIQKKNNINIDISYDSNYQRTQNKHRTLVKKTQELENVQTFKELRTLLAKMLSEKNITQHRIDKFLGFSENERNKQKWNLNPRPVKYSIGKSDSHQFLLEFKNDLDNLKFKIVGDSTGQNSMNIALNR